MPANFGVMQVGRLAMREDTSVSFQTEDGRGTLSISGQESINRLPIALIKKRLDDIQGLAGELVPVSFSHKTELGGYYRVQDVTGSYVKWVPEELGNVPWSMKLIRIGYPFEVDIESRLSGPVTRSNDFSATGKRWHAPARSHTAYAAGSTTPLFVTRTGLDGAMVVYTDIQNNINPRWSSTLANYLLGRCRFLDSDGLERSAKEMPLTATGWTMTNGLVRLMVNATTGAWEVAAWTGGAWQTKSWELFHSTGPAVTLGVPSAISLLHNGFEVTTLRMVKALNPGRVTVDFTIRRGSRFVEIYVQHQFGTTLKIVRSTVEASAQTSGYIRASAADGAGNRFVLGSARTFTADNVNGGISKAATATLDAFVGVEIAAPPTGDAAADLYAQYLGTPAELVQAVRY